MHDKKTATLAGGRPRPEALGYIDCPTCGTAGGMRVSHDKNGHPFGFCTATCRQQLRVGPDAERVGQFVKRYPFAAAGATAEPVPATEPTRYEKQREIAKEAAAPVAAPAARKRSGLADAMHFLAGGAA